MSVIDKYGASDPAREQRQINDSLGTSILDNVTLLDPALRYRRLDALVSGGLVPPLVAGDEGAAARLIDGWLGGFEPRGRAVVDPRGMSHTWYGIGGTPDMSVLVSAEAGSDYQPQIFANGQWSVLPIPHHDQDGAYWDAAEISEDGRVIFVTEAGAVGVVPVFSLDGGTTFNRITGFPGGLYQPYAHLSRIGRRVILIGGTPTTSTFFYTSSDSGQSWAPSYDTGQNTANVFGKVSADGSTIVGYTDRALDDGFSYVYISRNFGATWTTLKNTDLGFSNVGFAALAVSFDGSSMVLFSYDGTDVEIPKRSDNGGQTWHQITALPGSPGSPFWLASSPMSDDGSVILAGTQSAIVVSRDSGNSWQPIMSPAPSDFATVAMSADGKRIAITGDSDSPLWRYNF